MMVVFHHATGTLGSQKYWNEEVLGGIFHPGRAGVYFFFALSGFIIMWAHDDQIGRSDGQVGGVLVHLCAEKPILGALHSYFFGRQRPVSPAPAIEQKRRPSVSSSALENP